MCFIYINTDVGWLVEQRRKASVTLRLCSTSCPLSGYVVIKRFCLFVCFAKLVINCALYVYKGGFLLPLLSTVLPILASFI